MEDGGLKMAKPFPDPNITTVTSWFHHVNTLTSGLAIPIFLLTFTIVVFILTARSERYDISACFLVAFFLSFVFAAILWMASVLAGKIVVIYLLLTIGSGIANELARR